MGSRTLSIIIFGAILSCNEASNCDESICKLPDCACISSTPPYIQSSQADSYNPKDYPQFVILTFDDAVTITNFPIYEELLNYKNPNGCPIKMTFFVSHIDSNYQYVHELHRRGHEIASHSISNKSPNDAWKKMDLDTWRKEMGGMRRLLSKFADIPIEDIQGARAPGLQTAGNITIQALVDEGFKYDCSMPSRQSINNPLFPYTFDYGFSRENDCQIEPCLKPNDVYPGFWSFPMVDYTTTYYDEDWGVTIKRECATVDACIPKPETVNETIDFFRQNFERHYKKNRAPFPMFLREGWFTENMHRKQGMFQFIQDLLNKKDVYFVTIQELIQWMQSGPNAIKLIDYKPICKEMKKTECMMEDDSASANNCLYHNVKELGKIDKNMVTCVNQCPKSYPWVGNEYGNK